MVRRTNKVEEKDLSSETKKSTRQKKREKQIKKKKQEEEEEKERKLGKLSTERCTIEFRKSKKKFPKFWLILKLHRGRSSMFF